MTFEEWLDEVEVFSLRRERLYDDIELGDVSVMMGWLRTAYELGRDQGRSEV